ncbi:MAG: sigma-70 family RNA polymerase sigma factor [Pirellula sp.]
MNDQDGESREKPSRQDLFDWFQKYRPVLKSIVAKKLDKELGQKFDGSDVIQDVLNAAQANIDELSSKRPSEIRGYFRRVLLTKIEDLRRRFLKSAKRDIRRELTKQEISSDEFREIAGVDGSPLDLMIDQEHLRQVKAAVEALPNEIQNVLTWRFEHGMTFEEIGGRIGRSKDDVRMLIQRCIARLKKQLEDS